MKLFSRFHRHDNGALESDNQEGLSGTEELNEVYLGSGEQPINSSSVSEESFKTSDGFVQSSEEALQSGVFSQEAETEDDEDLFDLFADEIADDPETDLTGDITEENPDNQEVVTAVGESGEDSEDSEDFPIQEFSTPQEATPKRRSFFKRKHKSSKKPKETGKNLPDNVELAASDEELIAPDGEFAVPDKGLASGSVELAASDEEFIASDEFSLDDTEDIDFESFDIYAEDENSTSPQSPEPTPDNPDDPTSIFSDSFKLHFKRAIIRVKYAFAGVLILGVLVTSTRTVPQFVDTNKPATELALSGSNYMDYAGVTGWCAAFMQGDFYRCDALSDLNEEGFNDFYTSDYTSSSIISSQVYELMLTKCVQGVLSMEQVDIKRVVLETTESPTDFVEETFPDPQFTETRAYETVEDFKTSVLMGDSMASVVQRALVQLEELDLIDESLPRETDPTEPQTESTTATTATAVSDKPESAKEAETSTSSSTTTTKISEVTTTSTETTVNSSETTTTTSVTTQTEAVTCNTSTGSAIEDSSSSSTTTTVKTTVSGSNTDLVSSSDTVKGTYSGVFTETEVVTTEPPTSTEDIFHITVTFKPYKTLDTFVLDKEEYKDITDRFLTGDLSEEDYTQELNDFIINSLDKGFELSDEERTLTFDLVEGDMDGIPQVKGGMDLVKLLMQEMNIAEVEQVFETAIADELSAAAKQYECEN